MLFSGMKWLNKNCLSNIPKLKSFHTKVSVNLTTTLRVLYPYFAQPDFVFLG